MSIVLDDQGSADLDALASEADLQPAHGSLVDMGYQSEVMHDGPTFLLGASPSSGCWFIKRSYEPFGNTAQSDGGRHA